MKNTLHAILATFILAAPTAFARNHEVGNGGDAIRISEFYYSFDLFESGLQTRPYFRKDVKINPKIHEKLELAVDPEIFPMEVLEQKLSELYLDDPNFAEYVIETMKSYAWRFVSGPLKDVDDDQDTVINPPSGLVQAAIRRKETITVSTDVWLRMNPNNQAALVLHEALYAMVQPRSADPVPTDRSEFSQESVAARRAVGFLFSRDFEPKVKGWNWFLSLDSIKMKLIKTIPRERTLVLVKDAFNANAGEKYAVSVQIVQNGNPVRSWDLLSDHFDDVELAKICDRKELGNLPDSQQIIKLIPLRSELTALTPFYNAQTAKLDWGNYENLWSFYPGFARTALSDSYIVQKSVESCVAGLKSFTGYEF